MLLTNRQYAFARILERQAIVVVVNNDDSGADLRVRIPYEGKVTDLSTGKEVTVEGMAIQTHVEGCDGKLFLIEK